MDRRMDCGGVLLTVDEGYLPSATTGTAKAPASAAKEYVRALREVAETARVDLMGGLAANHLARQEPRKAIALLENGLEHQPDREDLARKLRAAYLETGQHARAAELQKEHALDT